MKPGYLQKQKNCFAGMISLALLLANFAYSQDLQAEIESIENGLTKNILVKGVPVEKFSLQEWMVAQNVIGLSVAIVKDGKLRWTKGYGIANPTIGKKVDGKTLFQAGSISKPIAALAALQLVEQGKLDLDEDVNTYLQSWKLKENKYTLTEKVTLRRLLTHTAGMTVHGFPGYQQSDEFPEINTVLDGKGNTPKITVDTIPGSIWRYSGGGYTLMEKIVEDVSAMPLEEYMARFVFPKINMKHSTYQQPLSKKLHSNASAAFDSEGQLITGLWNNYPEQAAAGLWTTPTDLARYCIEIQEINNGKEGGVLNLATVEDMLTMDKNGWGLGPSLEFIGEELTFGHGGKNAGFTNNMIAFADKGDAMIIMTNSDNGGSVIESLARSIGQFYGWDFAKAREIELVEVSEEELNTLTGEYKMNPNVSGMDEYKVRIEVEDGNLKLLDHIRNISFSFLPMADSNFIEIESGDIFRFQKDKESGEQSFTFNNRYRFTRID